MKETAEGEKRGMEGERGEEGWGQTYRQETDMRTERNNKRRRRRGWGMGRGGILCTHDHKIPADLASAQNGSGGNSSVAALADQGSLYELENAFEEQGIIV